MANIDKIRVDGIDYDIKGTDIYSTTEQVVGIWIDGRPIYKKSLSFTPSSGDNLIAHAISSLGDVVKCYRNNYNGQWFISGSNSNRIWFSF